MHLSSQHRPHSVRATAAPLQLPCSPQSHHPAACNQHTATNLHPHASSASTRRRRRTAATLVQTRTRCSRLAPPRSPPGCTRRSQGWPGPGRSGPARRGRWGARARRRCCRRAAAAVAVWRRRRRRHSQHGGMQEDDVLLHLRLLLLLLVCSCRCCLLRLLLLRCTSMLISTGSVSSGRNSDSTGYSWPGGVAVMVVMMSRRWWWQW